MVSWKSCTMKNSAFFCDYSAKSQHDGLIIGDNEFTCEFQFISGESLIKVKNKPFLILYDTVGVVIS